MRILPWFLNWPPRPTTIAVVLLLTVGSVVGLGVFGGDIDSITRDEASIEAPTLSVALNDDHTYPDGTNGSVQTCFASGPPGDSILVSGDVDLTIPATEESARLVVSLDHTAEQWTERVSRRGELSVDILWVLEDDERLDVGDRVTVEIHLEDGDTTIANRSEDVVVENGSRTYDC